VFVCVCVCLQREKVNNLGHSTMNQTSSLWLIQWKHVNNWETEVYNSGGMTCERNFHYPQLCLSLGTVTSNLLIRSEVQHIVWSPRMIWGNLSNISSQLQSEVKRSWRESKVYIMESSSLKISKGNFQVTFLYNLDVQINIQLFLYK